MRDFKGCILACDVDGTLVSGDFLPEENIEKISEFVSLGGTFALATGRSVGAVGAVLEKLKKYIGPSVVANGCMIYDYSTDKVLGQKTIPDNVKKLVFEAAEKIDPTGVEIHNGFNTYVYKDDPEVRDHQSYEGLSGLIGSQDEIFKSDWNKALFTSVEPETLLKIDEFFKERCKDARCVPTNADIYGRKRHYREILPNGVNKASTLRDVLKLLNIKEGGFFAIGDYFNDIQMLSEADISACPNDAPDEVKKSCDFLTKPARYGAVADFIDYLISKEIEK